MTQRVELFCDADELHAESGKIMNAIQMHTNTDAAIKFLNDASSLLSGRTDASRKIFKDFIDSVVIGGELFRLVGKSESTSRASDLVISILPSDLGLELLAALRAGNIDEFILDFKSHG